jgi:hypothetical protein
MHRPAPTPGAHERCVGADGKLQPFDERFERMVQWQARKEPTLSRAELEKKKLAYMATMPAWKNHPRVRTV